MYVSYRSKVRLKYKIITNILIIVQSSLCSRYKQLYFGMFLQTGHSTIKVKRTMDLHGLLIRCMNHVNHGWHDTCFSRVMHNTI